MVLLYFNCYLMLPNWNKYYLIHISFSIANCILKFHLVFRIFYTNYHNYSLKAYGKGNTIFFIKNNVTFIKQNVYKLDMTLYKLNILQ